MHPDLWHSGTEVEYVGRGYCSWLSAGMIAPLIHDAVLSATHLFAWS